MILSLTLATFSFVSASTARPPTQATPLAPEAFRRVVLPATPSLAPEASGSAADPSRGSTAPSSSPPPPIVDFRAPPSTVDPRPNPDAAAVAVAESKPTPAPKAVAAPAIRSGGKASTSGHSVSGQASWYCKTGVSACAHGYPGGLYAAAGPALRVGNWRGRTVQVCGGGGCITVRLIDWCACGGGRTGRIIDLYGDAYQRLAPLNTGTQRVRVSW